MAAYYNEIDPFAAEWIRELIRQGHIAPGDVDTRSIEDVCPDDLRKYTQCHFFAGIGVWSYALRKAGWEDDRPVWTGSCPCQPFSAAGKGAGFTDERHLWPAFFHLIRERQPSVIFGEQVASKDGLAWLDLVQADMEAEDYAIGPIDLCAAGVGAPNIRQRLFWVADTSGIRQSGPREMGRSSDTAAAQTGEVDRAINACGRSRLADANLDRCSQAPVTRIQDKEYHIKPCSGVDRPSPTNGHWRDVDWLACRDGKWRPVEPGTFPLAHGASARMGRLRGYGNAINAEVATAFIEAYMSL